MDKTAEPAAPPRRRGRPAGSSKGRKYTQVTAHLPPDLVRALDAQVQTDGIESRSEIIRIACSDLLRRRQQEGQPTKKEREAAFEGIYKTFFGDEAGGNRAGQRGDAD